MAKFNLGETDYEDLSEEFYRSSNTPEIDEEMPSAFYLLKRKLSEDSSSLFESFFASLPYPYNLSVQLSPEKLNENRVPIEEARSVLLGPLMNGVANEGGIASNDEERAKELAGKILDFEDELLSIYHFEAGISFRFYHYCEKSFLFEWKNHCAVLVLLGWD